MEAAMQPTTLKSQWGNEVLACDGNCAKAWGTRRPHIQLSDDIDDVVYMADWELGDAPSDPGSYEGVHGKPDIGNGPERQNKWCARECERSVYVPPDQEPTAALPNYSRRIFNKPWLHAASTE